MIVVPVFKDDLVTIMNMYFFITFLKILHLFETPDSCFIQWFVGVVLLRA